MNGRNGIYMALVELGLEAGDTILLPAFHCVTLVEPVIAFGARVAYYGVARDLAVDIGGIEAGLRAGARAVLLVHYFGFPAPAVEIRELCRAHGACLIEDCTHALYSRAGDEALGTFGDAAVFSFRKTLPVQDGGALVLAGEHAGAPRPRRVVPWLFHLKMLKWTAGELLAPDCTRTIDVPEADSRGASDRGAPEAAGDRAVLPRSGPTSFSQDEFVAEWAEWPASWITRWILRRSDAGAIAAARRRNYEQIAARISDVAGVRPLFERLGEGVVPLGFPLTSETDRRIDYSLRKRGVPAFSFGEELHPGLPRDRFPDAVWLSERLTVLPVHQDLQSAEIDSILDVLEALGTEQAVA